MNYFIFTLADIGLCAGLGDGHIFVTVIYLSFLHLCKKLISVLM